MQSSPDADDWFDPDIRRLGNRWAGKVTVEAAPNSFIQFSTEDNNSPDETVARLERAVVDTLMLTPRSGPGRRTYDGTTTLRDLGYAYVSGMKSFDRRQQ